MKQGRLPEFYGNSYGNPEVYDKLGSSVLIAIFISVPFMAIF